VNDENICEIMMTHFLQTLASEPKMLWVIILFLGLSLILYCLLAGADFGAGILELFMRKQDRTEQRKIIDRALGPVWEANHMWLILMIVILFVGFPSVYTRVSINLHIPLTAMLMGIIARGCSFTFRHYDAIQGRSQKPYNFFFIASSFWTPFFLGIIMGSLILGKLNPTPENYYDGYIAPWLAPFPLVLGVFTLCLFAFLAAVYLIGESPHGKIRNQFIKRAKWACMASVITGGGVFLTAQLSGLGLLGQFQNSIPAWICVLLTTLSLPFLWISIQREYYWMARIISGSQVALILCGWLSIQFPILVQIKGAEDLTLFNAHAPGITLYYLGMALIFGGILILPSLYFLLRVFKKS